MVHVPLLKQYLHAVYDDKVNTVLMVDSVHMEKPNINVLVHMFAYAHAYIPYCMFWC